MLKNFISIKGRIFNFIFVSLLIMNSLQAQNCVYPWSVEMGIGISEYSGARGNGFFKFDLVSHKLAAGGRESHNRPGIAYVAVNKSANTFLDLSLRYYHGEWGYFDKEYSSNNFTHQVGALEFIPRWKFLGNYNRYVIPYLTLGLGVRRIKLQTPDPKNGIFGMDKEGLYEMNFPVGLGLTVRLYHRLSLNLISAFVWTTHGDVSATTNNYYQNKIWNHTIGLMYNLGEPIACQMGKPMLCPPFGRRR